MLEKRDYVEISMPLHLHRLTRLSYDIDQVITSNARRQSICFDEGANLIAALVFVFLFLNYSRIEGHKELVKATKYGIIFHNANLEISFF